MLSCMEKFTLVMMIMELHSIHEFQCTVFHWKGRPVDFTILKH